MASTPETPAPATPAPEPPAQASPLPTPVLGSSSTQALLVDGATAASSTTATPAVGSAASPAPVADDDGSPAAASSSRTTGAMDRFVKPYVPGSDEAAQMFVATNLGAASSFGRQRKTVGVRKSIDDGEGASSEGGPKAKRSRGVNALSTSNPKTISPASRVGVFPDDGLIVSVGKLFCQPCGCRLGTRKSTIMNHVGLKKDGSHKTKVNKHMKKLVAWTADKLETPARIARFVAYCQGQQYGKGLLPEVNDSRCKIITHIMAAGISASKLDALRPMFGELKANMCGSSMSKEYYGFIAEEEIRRTVDEIRGKGVSIAVDGTPFNNTEMFGACIRVVGEDLAVTKRLVRLRMLDGPMNNVNISAEIIDISMKRLEIHDRDHVLCFNFDGCSANRKAMRETVPNIFPKACFNACMSHLVDNTGKQVDAEVASNFMTKLGSVFSHSMVAQREFRKITGRSYPRHVAHRWGSLEEVMSFLMEENPVIEKFIRTFCNSDGRRNKTCQQLQEKYLDNVVVRRLLLLELALYNDILKVLKTACLGLEGDYALVHKAYDIIQLVASTLRLDDLTVCPNFPNVEALLRGDGQRAPSQSEEAALRSHVVKCTTDLRQYAQNQFGEGPTVKFRVELDLFKVARIINPHHVRQQQRDDVQPKALCIFPFVDKTDIIALEKELPKYINAAAAVRPTYPVRSFWVDNAASLPAWFDVVKKLWLVQPSSAMMERGVIPR